MARLETRMNNIPEHLDLLRSIMFTPGHRERMVRKALTLDADAIILDCEDGVPPEEKANSRDTIARVVSEPAEAPRPAVFVRVNSLGSEFAAVDIAALCAVRGVDGIVLPKAESAEDIRAAASLVGEAEAAAGIGDGTVRILAAIESAQGLLAAEKIAQADERLVALVFGAEDFALDVGLPVGRRGPGQEMLFARSKLVIAAAVAGIHALDQVWTSYQDEAGQLAETTTARHLGFTGKTIIHPSQIDVTNDAFAPSAEDVAQSARVVDAFDDAVAKGIGAVMVDGQLVELPIVERAQRTLRTHDRITAGGGRRRTVANADPSSEG